MEEKYTRDQIKDAIWQELKDSDYAGENNDRAYEIIGIVMAGIDKIVSGTRPGAAWVKASDFDMSKGGMLFYRFDGPTLKSIGIGHFVGDVFHGTHLDVFPKPDWKYLYILDESPAAAREEDAVEFAEWLAINNWVLRNDKTTWHWGPIGIPKEEWIVCTSSELYIKFKQQKEK